MRKQVLKSLVPFESDDTQQCGDHMSEETGSLVLQTGARSRDGEVVWRNSISRLGNKASEPASIILPGYPMQRNCAKSSQPMF